MNRLSRRFLVRALLFFGLAILLLDFVAELSEITPTVYERMIASRIELLERGARAPLGGFVRGDDAVMRLYTPEGQDHLAVLQLDPADLAPLAHEVQSWIHGIQVSLTLRVRTTRLYY